MSGATSTSSYLPGPLLKVASSLASASYSMGRRRTLANKLWRISGPPRDRDGTKVDVVVMGYWDRPLDEAVDLMNEWLARIKAV